MHRRIVAALAIVPTAIIGLSACDFNATANTQGTVTDTTSAAATTSRVVTVPGPTDSETATATETATETETTTPAPTSTPVGTPDPIVIGEGFYRVGNDEGEIPVGTYLTSGADGSDADTANDNSSFTRYSNVEGTGDAINGFNNGTGNLKLVVTDADASVLLQGPAQWTLQDSAS